MQDKAAAARIVAWTVVATSGGLGVLFAVIAWVSGIQAVDADVCASHHDNGWLLPMRISLIVAVLAMIVRFVQGTLPSQPRAAPGGLIGLGAVLISAVVLNVFAAAPYGWQC